VSVKALPTYFSQTPQAPSLAHQIDSGRGDIAYVALVLQRVRLGVGRQLLPGLGRPAADKRRREGLGDAIDAAKAFGPAVDLGLPIVRHCWASRRRSRR
jgi:hypothetical protein